MNDPNGQAKSAKKKKKKVKKKKDKKVEEQIQALSSVNLEVQEQLLENEIV